MLLKHLFLALFTSVCITSSAQEVVSGFNPNSYICYNTDVPIVIDGQADEKSWLSAPWTADFVDIEGDKKPPPRLRTRAKMLWDEEYFYFFAEMEEPHIWASLKQRDTIIFYDNDFEIFIDPDGDTHRYYEIEMNAFNTVWDLLLLTPYRDQANAVLNAWDIKGIKTAVDIQGTINDPTDLDEKWTVEIALPWEVLREQARGRRKPEDGEYWRVNFSRVEWQVDIVEGKYQKKLDSGNGKRLREDNWVWSPQGAINMHRPETWGFVKFSANAPEKGVGAFEIPSHEYIKWELRKLYYAQRDHFRKRGSYAQNLQQLNIKLPDLAELMTANSGYIISLPNKTQDKFWHIDEQGHTWQSNK